VACVGKINAFTVLVRKPEGQRPLTSLRRGFQVNITRAFTETG
jgi:hypothetical protein